jgi:hypothetical protein
MSDPGHESKRAAWLLIVLLISLIASVAFANEIIDFVIGLVNLANIGRWR